MGAGAKSLSRPSLIHSAFQTYPGCIEVSKLCTGDRSLRPPATVRPRSHKDARRPPYRTIRNPSGAWVRGRSPCRVRRLSTPPSRHIRAASRSRNSAPATGACGRPQRCGRAHIKTRGGHPTGQFETLPEHGCGGEVPVASVAYPLRLPDISGLHRGLETLHRRQEPAAARNGAAALT